MENHELHHHGVKGQKWGVRRYQNSDGSLTPAGKKRYGSGSGGGISGAIRRKQRSNAENDLNKVRSQKKQVDSELRELRGYDKNPTGLAASKISTAIRRSQMKSLEKTRSKLDAREKDDLDTLKELDDIERHKSKVSGKKAMDTFKKGANALLDKAESDNFFNSDSIFSEESMKRQSAINRVRDVVNSLSYDSLTSSSGRKQLIRTGKKVIHDLLDDADDRSFFNDDWDTRMKKQERNDFIRGFVND